VTPRILLIATLLIFVNCYWIMQVEGIWHTNHATAMSLFWNTIFFLLLLVLLNIFVLKRWFPRQAFTQGELITCYFMMNIGTALAGHDSLQLGIPAVMGFPIWYQNQQPSLGWEKWTRFFPDWAMVKNIENLKPVYYGSATQLLYTPDHLRAWAVPVLAWCGFVVALGTVWMGMCQIIRKQWTESEKLAYPIVQLPLAMTQDGGTRAFFQNKPFWIGILIGAALNIWNGLATFYPTLPLVSVRHDAPGRNLGEFFTTYPYNQAGWIPMPLYPFLIALGYFLPLDLSFSLWFFFLFKIGLRVVAAQIGVAPGQQSSFPYFEQQSFGAWFVIIGVSLWAARAHLKQVWLKIVEPKSSTLDETDEPISYRMAALAILLGMAYLTVFCLSAGMTLTIFLLYFGFVFLLSIGITRLRAELGPPAHEMAGNLNGTGLLTLFLGTQGVGLQNLTIMSLFWWFSGRGYRTHPMPVMLEGMKMGQQSSAAMRGMGFAMILALAVGAFASFWAALHLQYGAGINAMTAHNWGQFQQVHSFAAPPARPTTPARWPSA
jgi:hypothetical protein